MASPREVRMTEGSIIRHLFRFAVPLLIGNIFQQMYNTVDTWVVGNYVSNEAFSAVGSVGPIINMLIGFFMGLSNGTGVVIAQYYGAKREKEVHDTIHTAIVMTLCLAVVFTFLGIKLIPFALDFMKTPTEVIPESTKYLTIYFAGVVGLMIYNIGTGILNAVGDTRRPFFFLVVSAVLNTILDLVFVLVFGMGVEGVAYATIIAQGVSAILILITLMRSDSCIKLILRDLRIHFSMLSKIIKVGIPSAIQMAITSFSNVFVQSYINYFGSACMAGWSSYNKLDSYITVPLQAIALASTTFVGQNYGSNNLERTRKGVNQALGMSLVVTAALGVLVMIFARPCLRLFTADAEVMEYGTRFIMIISPFYIMSCFNQIYAGALRGVGNANIPMIVMLGSFVVFRQVYLLVNRIAFDNSFLGVSLAYPMGWVVCSILLFICYRRSVICHPEKAKAKAVEEVAAE